MSEFIEPDASISAAPRMPWRWLRWNLHHLTNISIVLFVIGLVVFGWAGLWFAIPVVLFAVLLTDGIARPGSSLFYPTVTHGPRRGKQVALTFDDGPDPVVTPQVLDALAEAGAHATFFVIGKSLAANPALARRMLSEGHVVGNHSWQHSRLQNFYFANWHTREINAGMRAIAEATGQAAPRLYRPPVGLKSWAVGRAAARHGLTLVAWSLHSRDTRLPSAEQVARRVLDRVQAGDIVLLHDGHDLPGRGRPFCAQAVRLILQGLRKKGLQCVTVPELLDFQAETARRRA
ncbi:MAG TPA: polysaccharide deacetylase family protein [Gammaproteobacteria bacterium]